MESKLGKVALVIWKLAELDGGMAIFVLSLLYIAAATATADDGGDIRGIQRCHIVFSNHLDIGCESQGHPRSQLVLMPTVPVPVPVPQPESRALYQPTQSPSLLHFVSLTLSTRRLLVHPLVHPQTPRMTKAASSPSTWSISILTSACVCVSEKSGRSERGKRLRPGNAWFLPISAHRTFAAATVPSWIRADF